MLDMGVTTPVFPSRSCQHDMSTASCKTPPQATAGVSESELQKLSHYLQLIGVPSQRSVRSGFMAGVRVSAEHDVDPVRIANGARLFGQAGCTACHVAQMKTGNAHPFAELRNSSHCPSPQPSPLSTGAREQDYTTSISPIPP